MHDINYTSPDKPPSGDSVIVVLLVALGLVAVLVAAAAAFSIWWPTFVGD